MNYNQHRNLLFHCAVFFISNLIKTRDLPGLLTHLITQINVKMIALMSVMQIVEHSKTLKPVEIMKNAIFLGINVWQTNITLVLLFIFLHTQYNHYYDLDIRYLSRLFKFIFMLFPFRLSSPFSFNFYFIMLLLHLSWLCWPYFICNLHEQSRVWVAKEFRKRKN